MGIKKKILYILLFIVNVFVRLFPIKKNRITFVSLESKVLESDLKLIYNNVVKTKEYDLQCVLMKFDSNSIWNNFRYMLNTIKQIWYINRSKIVILNDNNYVVSTFKRTGVSVIQIWHAAGAIKKFGNALKREYPIRNYDYVIANSEYWKEPYAEAFGVSNQQVKVLGMPRLDHLTDMQYREMTKEKLLQKYPLLKGKKVILYAPTFRGDIYKGFYGVDMDCDAIMKEFNKEYVFIYKLHPLLKDNRLEESKYAYNMNMEKLHDLFTVTDILISDFSSVIFDFLLFEKPILLYVPDEAKYFEEVGTFVSFPNEISKYLCYQEDDIIQTIKKLPKTEDNKDIRNRFFKYQDGNNLERVVTFIHSLMK